MTPGARIAAAIALLDQIGAGANAEAALTRWARSNRYAGSGDRNAVRDHVFDALRCWRSSGVLGGGTDGRAVMIGMLRQQGIAPESMFTGAGYAPEPLTEAETAFRSAPMTPAEAADLPDWIWSRLQADHGDLAGPIAAALRHRAPVMLRANLARGDRAAARAALAEDGIETVPSDLAATALTVQGPARALRQSRAFRDGLVELQDGASQAAVEALGPVAGLRVLDFCAGGGGKALALAALGAEVTAHDADPGRMADLPERAARAGVRIDRLSPEGLARAGRFDLVFCDAPCSGSGAWRRSPQAKWTLTPEALTALVTLQRRILRQALTHVAPGGRLGYATCSLMSDENAGARDWAAVELGLSCVASRSWTPLDGGDGFFCALFRRV